MKNLAQESILNEHEESKSDGKFRLKPNLKRTCFIIFFTFLSVAANFAGGKLATQIYFPLYLDSIMTICVVSIGGLIPGIICAAVSNFLLAGFRPVAFGICHVFTALGAFFVFKKRKLFENAELFESSKNDEFSLELFLWAGLFSAVSNTIFGNIISAFVIKGNFENLLGILQETLYISVPNTAFVSWTAGFLENLMDKLLSAILSFFVYKIVLIIQRKCGWEFLKSF